MDPKLAVILRTKKLGILIRDARLAVGKSMKECGEAIDASSSKISSFEKGKKSPSLPELELLSFFLNVPITRFWKDEIKSTESTTLEEFHIEHGLILRDRTIGKTLEEARKNTNLTYKDIREETGIPLTRMKKYEQGESPIPLPELELLSNLLEINIPAFFNSDTTVGKWVVTQNSIEDFLKLPPEMQRFVSKPVNLPYLELAQKLSSLSTDQLRSVAEGLLEITI